MKIELLHFQSLVTATGSYIHLRKFSKSETLEILEEAKDFYKMVVDLL